MSGGHSDGVHDLRRCCRAASARRAAARACDLDPQADERSSHVCAENPPAGLCDPNGSDRAAPRAGDRPIRPHHARSAAIPRGVEQPRAGRTRMIGKRAGP